MEKQFSCNTVSRRALRNFQLEEMVDVYLDREYVTRAEGSTECLNELVNGYGIEYLVSCFIVVSNFTPHILRVAL